MARHDINNDSWESWEGDDEWVPDDESLEDIEAGGDLPTVPCPYCQELLPQDAPRCPYCENYVSAEDTPPAGSGRKPWWIIIGALLVFFIVYRWIVK
jgi:hypothetical protein